MLMTDSERLAADVRYIRGRVDKVSDDVTSIRERVARLEVRAALWGGAAATVVAVIARLLG